MVCNFRGMPCLPRQNRFLPALMHVRIYPQNAQSMRHYILHNFSRSHRFRNCNRCKFLRIGTNVLNISETYPLSLCSPLRRRISPIKIETTKRFTGTPHSSTPTAAFRGSQPGCTELSRLRRAPSPCVQSLIFRLRPHRSEEASRTAESDLPDV